MPLSPKIRTVIAQAVAEVPDRERTATVRGLAKTYGVSESTIYRIAHLGGTPRPRAPQHPEYREWTRIAVALARKAPKRLPLDQAIRIGVEGGVLPPEAADMPLSTAQRLARKMGLRDETRRTHRQHADYPMQALLIDWSTSEHLVAERPDGDDWILKLHRQPWSAGGYKNKPSKPHGLRLGVYAAWDMCTGYVVARYVVARGENGFDGMEFLCWVLAPDKDKRLVLHGVPDDLWSDHGPITKNAATVDLLERLEIALIKGKPRAKERMGGVEGSHNTRWERFERTLFYRGSETIRLSEINNRLIEFTVEENARRLSRTDVDGRPASRADAWVGLTNARPQDNPLRRLPDNPIETLAREARRKVDVNGIVRWDGIEYECTDWHDRWVIARRAIDDSGDLTLEDEATREKRIARRRVPRPYGVIPQSPPSELDKLDAEYADLEVRADIYAPKPGTGATNVTPLPARSAPAAPLENPLAADRCRDLADAMRLFTSIYTYPLLEANRPLVVARIEESGLSRQAIIELAQELGMLAHARRQA